MNEEIKEIEDLFDKKIEELSDEEIENINTGHQIILSVMYKTTKDNVSMKHQIFKAYIYLMNIDFRKFPMFEKEVKNITATKLYDRLLKHTDIWSKIHPNKMSEENKKVFLQDAFYTLIKYLPN